MIPSDTRAVIVSVGYADMLKYTLPKNVHHFDEILVVTCRDDLETQAICSEFDDRVTCCLTDVFWHNSAVFNKGAAIEYAFSLTNRYGWFCVLDADIVLPSRIDQAVWSSHKLYVPQRRMVDSLESIASNPMQSWQSFDLNREVDFAGYCQIFHSEAMKGQSEWYPTDWIHAGGSDTEFAMKWHPANRERPGFNVLHIGESGKNWCGRSIGGQMYLQQLLARRNYKKPFSERYVHEKIRRVK